MGLIEKIFGSYSKRELKRIRPILQNVLDLEEEYKACLLYTSATEAQRGELAASSWERRHAAVMILRPTAAAIHSTQPPPA